MKFTDITEESKVYPGEYILHTPTSAIVMVGAFNRDKDVIRAFRDGRLFEDKISNFSKIGLDTKEQKVFRDKTCKKCKGARR